MQGGQQVEQGLNKIGQQTERVGRAQTRLGQASASAGRQFSAQAQGLGGLVQAYAGAAANIFAITAAFTALNQAARFEQIIAGTNALAATIGANGRDIIQNVQAITKSQLTLLETAQTVNIGLSAGFNTEQIEALSDVSLRASKALGRSLTDAFTRVSRGAAKLEPELLDELGIFTRIDPAVRKYADSVGRSVSSLTNFERRQAFANAVIEEGTRKFRDVDTSTRTAAESLEKLSSTIINIGLQFGAVLANAVAPFADFITDNLSNSLALFGLVAKQVGGLAAGVLAAGINSATASLTNLANAGVAALNSLSTNFKATTASVQRYTEANNLQITSNSKAAQAINVKLSALANEIRAGALTTRSRIEAARATVQEALAQERLALKMKQVDAARAVSRKRIIQFKTEIRLLTIALNQASGATNIFASSLGLLSRGVGLFGAALSKVLGTLFSVVTYLSLFQLGYNALADAFGFEQLDLFEQLVGLIGKVIEFFSDASSAIEGFATSFRGEMLRTVEVMGFFGTRAEEIVNKAQAAFGNLAAPRMVSGGVGDIDEIGAPFQLETSAQVLARITEGIADLRKQAEKFRNEGELVNARDAEAQARIIEDLSAKLILLGSGDILKGGQIAVVFEGIAETSGLAAAKVAELIGFGSQLRESFSGIDFDINSLGNVALTIGGISEQLTRINKDGVPEFREGFLGVASAIALGEDKVRDFNESFARGALDAEKAAQAVGAISSAIEQVGQKRTTAAFELDLVNKLLESSASNLTEEQRQQFELRQADLEAAIKLADAAKERLEIERAIKDAIAGQQADLEKQRKALQKVFGNPGEKIERLTLTGDVGPGGTIPGSAEEKRLNVTRALVANIEKEAAIKKALTQTERNFIDAEKGRIKDQSAIVSALDKEIVATQRLIDAGQNVGSNQERLQELAKARIKAQNEIADAQRLIGSLSADILAAEANSKLSLEALVALEGKRLDIIKKLFENTQKLAASTNLQALQAEVKTANQRLQLEKQLDQLIAKRSLQQLDNAKELESLFGNFTARDNAQFTREKVAIELGLAEKDANRAKKIAENNFKLAEAQRKAAKDQRDIQLAALKGRFAALDTERDLLQGFLTQFDDVLKSRIKELGDAAGLKINIADTRRGKIGEKIDANTALDAAGIDINTIEKNFKEIDRLTKQANEDALLFAKLFEDKKLEIAREGGAAAIKQAEIAARTSFAVFTSFRDGINETLEPALEGVFQSIADGTFTVRNLNDELNNFFRSLVENIRKKLLKETLIDPLTEGVTSSIKGSMFTKSGDDSGTGILSSIAGFFSGGKASGGLVHMAGGGQVRDRVPAMLEPGEFVIRKPMAKAIGGPVLNSMNATGSMPTGEVAVNITNTGTPQEATASPPRFDGEKMVVDIVMRDLRNNGPIRKSLRAGG